MFLYLYIYVYVYIYIMFTRAHIQHVAHHALDGTPHHNYVNIPRSLTPSDISQRARARTCQPPTSMTSNARHCQRSISDQRPIISNPAGQPFRTCLYQRRQQTSCSSIKSARRAPSAESLHGPLPGTSTA